MRFDAFWPAQLVQHGLTEHSLDSEHVLGVPRLSGATVAQLCQHLADQTTELRTRSVAELCGIIGQASALLTTEGHPLHQLAIEWIPITTGYSVEMTRYVLESMARDWTESTLLHLLTTELGDPARLDRFVSDAAAPRQTMAFGPRVTGQIFSGNVPGVAVTALIRALLVKSATFGKTARAEPVLPVLFARALAEVDERIARALVLAWWPGGAAELESALIEQCETMVVYGSADAIDAARRHARADTKLVLHGPKLSVGVVGPALNRASTPAIARAVATFDQQGCVSPHVVYVVGAKHEAAEFARMLADALRDVARELPRGRLRTEEAVALQQARASAEFRAIAGAEIELHAGPGLGFTVVYEANPTFQASCLNRFIYVKPLSDVHALIPLLHPFASLLQSVALEGLSPGETEAAAVALGTLGVSRICSFTALPWPVAYWHHDGQSPIRELLRWCDVYG